MMPKMRQRTSLWSTAPVSGLKAQAPTPPSGMAIEKRRRQQPVGGTHRRRYAKADPLPRRARSGGEGGVSFAGWRRLLRAIAIVRRSADRARAGRFLCRHCGRALRGRPRRKSDHQRDARFPRNSGKSASRSRCSWPTQSGDIETVVRVPTRATRGCWITPNAVTAASLLLSSPSGSVAEIAPPRSKGQIRRPRCPLRSTPTNSGAARKGSQDSEPRPAAPNQLAFVPSLRPPAR